MRAPATFLSLALLAVSFVSPPASAEDANQCLQMRVAQENTSRDEAYRLRNGTGVELQKQSLFIPGRTDRVVVLFHGFLASPEEMREFAERVNSNQGHAVYAPLIFGFGDNERVANSTSLAEWQSSVRRSVESAAECFATLELGGHSMGAGLLADFVFHESEITSRGTLNGKSIARLVFYSPYWLGHPLSLLLAPIVASELNHRDSLPVREIAEALQSDAFNELMPGFSVNDSIPLRALSTLLQMRRFFLLGGDGTSAVRVPTLVVYSEDDPLIDTRFIPILVRRHFRDATFRVTLEGSGVRHRTIPIAPAEDFSPSSPSP